jgi:hypothetical protein
MSACVRIVTNERVLTLDCFGIPQLCVCLSDLCEVIYVSRSTSV